MSVQLQLCTITTVKLIYFKGNFKKVETSFIYKKGKDTTKAIDIPYFSS